MSAATPLDLVAELQPLPRDGARRAALLAHPSLNGIDWVEYVRTPAPALLVRMLRNVPDATVYGLRAHPERAVVAGGTRVQGVRALAVERAAPRELRIPLSAEGDFGAYWLALGWLRGADGRWTPASPDIDRVFSLAPFTFKAGCPADWDCEAEDACAEPPLPPEPHLDYLARDYASFRRMLLDLAAERNPGWTERSPADLGVAVVELMAYLGDQLSYFQDAVAGEAYLETARQRVSVRRHARLVDYAMHDGRNAWTWVHLQVSAAGTVPARTPLLTRIEAPLRGEAAPPGRTVQAWRLPPDAFRTDPALAGARVFETASALAADPLCNLLRVHAWGDDRACLPRGARGAFVYAVSGPAGSERAVRPPLAAGQWLLLEEVKGPDGAPEAADPEHRAVVRITGAHPASDPAFADRLFGGEPRPFQAGDTPLPLVQLAWDAADAPPFPVCLRAVRRDGGRVTGVSVARGNLVPADHGRTVEQRFPSPPRPVRPGAPLRLGLSEGPLTFEAPPQGEAPAPDATGHRRGERQVLDAPVEAARPAAWARVRFGAETGEWAAVPDLLDSPADDPAFVAEVGNDGRAALRFGDGEYGRAAAGADEVWVGYRVGNGAAGNVGADALHHLVVPAATLGWPAVDAVRNPLPARGGTEPESLEQVRQYAPAALHGRLLRAVTAEDYAAVARRLEGVAGAVAAFRWTGSWHTVYVGIDPVNPDHLVTEAGGRTRLQPDFERRVHAWMGRHRLAGYDLEVRTARYVPLEVEVELCVCRDHFRADVARAVRRALAGREPGGFFHPDRFGFGEPVRLSRLYAAVEAVQGVESAAVTVLRRRGGRDRGELETGVLEIGPWEIARLDDDPGAAENGVLRVVPRGGK